MKVTRKGDVIKVKIERIDAYNSDIIGKTVLKLTNNGNGWTAKFPSFSSTQPVRYLNIDYDEMAPLLRAAVAMEPGEVE